MSEFKIIVRNGTPWIDGRVKMIPSSKAAEMLGVSRARVAQLVGDRRLHHVRIGNQTFVRESDVEAYARSRK